MQTEGKSLAAKLVAVMGAVDYIPKKGKNAAQNYQYATDADISDRVRTAMTEQRVVMLSKVTAHSVRQIEGRNGALNINTVEMDFTFIDADSGEAFTISTIGEGMDSGDKGVYKAMTGATKYALLKAFQIPTGDDPEKDNGDEPAPRPTAQRSQPAQSAPKAAPTGPVTMPYGKSKGKAVTEASYDDLRWMLGTLTDAKLADAQYGESNRKLFAALTAEIERRDSGEDMGEEVPSDGLPFDGDAA